MAKAESKLQAFTNLHKTKWNNSSAFQAFTCPAESTFGLIKTNLLVPEDTAITQTNPGQDDQVSSMTQTKAFQLYIHPPVVDFYR